MGTQHVSNDLEVERAKPSLPIQTLLMSFVKNWPPIIGYTQKEKAHQALNQAGLEAIKCTLIVVIMATLLRKAS